MTIANKFLKELSLIERDRRNYADGLLLCGFMERVRRAAVDEAWPFGVNSHDATRRFTFEDGSILYVGNPEQATYPVTAYEKTERACRS